MDGNELGTFHLVVGVIEFVLQVSYYITLYFYCAVYLKGGDLANLRPQYALHTMLSYSDAALCVPTDCQVHWVSVDTSIGATAVCSILCVATIFQSDHRTYTKHVCIEYFSKLLRKRIWKWISEQYDI